MFNLTKLSSLTLLFFALGLVFTACEKENLQETITPTEEVVPQARLGAALSKALPPGDSTNQDAGQLCFFINFPLSLRLENGETYTVANEDELVNIPENILVADFVYPFTVTLGDGTITEINAFEDFIGLLVNCYGDFDDWEYDDEHDECPDDYDFDDIFDCFSFIYPISFTDSVIVTTVNSDDEFFAFLDGLENEEGDLIDFVFPFEVTYHDDSTTLVIEDYEDLDDLFIDCFELDDDDDDENDDDDDDENDEQEEVIVCFDLVYPVQLTDDNGALVTVNDYEELEDLFGDDYHDALVFPLSILRFETTEAIVIRDADEYEDLLDFCQEESEREPDGPGRYDEDYLEALFDGCLTIELPVTITLTDGGGNSLDRTIDNPELLRFFLDWERTPDPTVDINYPINLTQNATGTVVTVTDKDQLDDLVATCDD
ncbi:MAG: hypothetical protein AAGF89_02755 [Bacteroidota bacterium]